MKNYNLRVVAAALLLAAAVFIVGFIAVKHNQNDRQKDDISTTSSVTSAVDASEEVTEDTTENTDDVPENTPAVSDENYTAPSGSGATNATLYIRAGGSYKTVQTSFSGDKNVRNLLGAIARETNWNLDAQNISVSDNKIVISWSKDSSLYSGIPSSQSKTYYVATQDNLDRMILESVKSTLQNNLGSSYKVYYTAPDGGNLVLPDTQVTIPASSEYTSYSDYEPFFPG